MNRVITAISLLASFLTIGDVTWKIISGQEYNMAAVIIVIAIIMIFQTIILILLKTDVDEKDSYIPFIIYSYIPMIIIASLVKYFRMASDINQDTGLVFKESISLSIMIFFTIALYIFWSEVFKTNFHRNKTLQGAVFGLSASSVIGMLIYVYVISNTPVNKSLWGFIVLIVVITASSAIINIFPMAKDDKTRLMWGEKEMERKKKEDSIRRYQSKSKK